MAGDSTAADVLRLLADCESTGTLELTGPPSGVFRLESGLVTAVVTDAVPDLATRLARAVPAVGDAERRAVARSVILDGATVLLARPLSAPPRFFTGPPDAAVRERTEPDVRVDVPGLLAEAGARVALLAEAPVGPDDVVTVRPVLGRRSVRLGPIAWQLLRGLQEPRTARSLAWGFGFALVDTLIAVADMVDQQACEARRPAGARPLTAGPSLPPGPGRPPLRPDHGRPDHGRPDHGRPDHGRPVHGRPDPAAAPARPGVPPGVPPGAGAAPGARPAPGPVQGPPAPATVVTTLPRRRILPGGTSSPAAPPAPHRLAVPDRDLLLRVLEGLRRL